MVGAGLLFLQALISGDEGGPVTSALQEARNGHGQPMADVLPSLCSALATHFDGGLTGGFLQRCLFPRFSGRFIIFPRQCHLM
jgi:hypothetical protein